VLEISKRLAKKIANSNNNINDKLTTYLTKIRLSVLYMCKMLKYMAALKAKAHIYQYTKKISYQKIITEKGLRRRKRVIQKQLAMVKRVK